MKKYSVFDAHCDTLCSVCDMGGDVTDNVYNTDTRRMREYKSYSQIYAMFISPEYYTNPKERMKALYDIYCKSDFTGITPYLSVEGGEVIDSLEDIDYLKNMGVRCINLTWNNSNKICGGADDALKGLTPFGRDVVRKLNEKDILIDVSHLNDKSFYNIAEISTKPLIATHSNSRLICNHRRNLTDDMFKIICESNGCVGINLYPPFVKETGECKIEDVILHIEHFLSLGGENHVGIGADFDGVSNNLPQGIEGCEHLYILFDKMSDLGYSDDITNKIAHRNFERIFAEEK